MTRMKTAVNLAFSLFLFLVAGCVQPKALFLASDYLQRQPRSIAVLPVEDARLTSGTLSLQEKLRSKGPEFEDRTAPAMFQAFINMALIGKGYNVFNLASVYEPGKTCNLALGLDAVLQSRLHDYERSYMAIARTDRLDMDISLLDCKTGDILWKERLVKHETRVGVIPAIEYPVANWISLVFSTLPMAK